MRPSERIAQHRAEILALVAEHHAENPRVFGSVARGEDGPDSDVDLLVDFSPQARLLDEIGLRLDLSDLLGVPVDVIGSDALRGDLRDCVLAEAVPL